MLDCNFHFFWADGNKLVVKYRIVCLKTGTFIFCVRFLLKCIAGTESKLRVIISDKLVNYGFFVP